MNAYSKDLRLRVLAAVERGTPYKEITRLFGISLPTIGRYVKRCRETGEVAPRPSPGRSTPTILATTEHKKALQRSSLRTTIPLPLSAIASCGKNSGA
jgi:transposase